MRFKTGRPPRICREDIIRAGRNIGMQDLSLHAVANELEVSTPALYRYVKGRWDLEELIGENILADLTIEDNPDHGVVTQLLGFGMQLRSFALKNPGIVEYMQVLFPRGDSGRRLFNSEVQALVRRGYNMESAIPLSATVAFITIGYVAAEIARAELEAEGLAERREQIFHDLQADEEISKILQKFPDLDDDQYVRLHLTAIIRGLVTTFAPGKDFSEAVTELDNLRSEE